ncbi:MAG: acyltransferase [Mucilaginibacter sp.]
MGLIRILLAIAVLLGHAGFSSKIVGGDIAVEAFYIISGFYMSLILHEKYVGSNNSYKLFITNRFLRIFPLYWLVLVITVGYSLMRFFILHQPDAPLSAYQQYSGQMGLLNTAFLIFTNICIFFQDWLLFLGFNKATGLLFFTTNFQAVDPQLYHFLFVPQAWTISLELLFYLLAPFILKRSVRVVIVLIVISISIKVLLFYCGLNHDPWTYRFFPAEMHLFLLGYISYIIYNRIKGFKINIIYLNGILLMVCLFTLMYWAIPGQVRQYLYLSLLFIALPFIFLHTNKWKFDRYVGELSYPIYILHNLIIAFTASLFPHSIYSILIVLLATIGVSILLNELVAKKIERIRQRRLNKIKA